MNSLLTLSALLLVLTGSARAHEHHAHVHGVAKLDVAVEGNRLEMHLDSPLEALLGFEHVPRDARERAAVAAMRRSLEQGGKAFAPTAAAQCRLAKVALNAPVLDEKAGHADEHGDLDADFHFSCAAPGKLTGLAVHLFDAFPRLKRIDARVVSEKGQSAVRLTGKMRFLSW